MAKSSELYIASTSDVHMGHPRVPTAKTFACIKAAFPDNRETAKLDMLIIAGDFYDRLLNLSQDDVQETDIAILYLLKLCKKHDITLVVLRGTPSHDWTQPERFVLHGVCQQPAAARAVIVAYMRREAGRLGKPFAPLSGDAINDKREG